MTVSERWKQDLDLVKAQHGPVEVATDMSWFAIPHWPLPAGWSSQHTTVFVMIPPGYPVTPPDNFYVNPDLRLENGAMPGSTSLVNQAGRQWLQFSYHVESGEWKPHADFQRGHNLLTFLQGVARRLGESS